MKSLAYYPLQCAKNAHEPLQAFLNSVKKFGINVVENSLDCDAVVIWSVLWHGKMLANQSVYNHYRSLGRPVFVIEVGALHRNITWKVAINNVNAQGYYGHKINLDYDRPKLLNIKLSKTTPHNPGILIVAQHHKSLQLSDVGTQELWMTSQILRIMNATTRPIMVRPHPRSALNASLLPLGVKLQQPKKINNTYDSFDVDYGYHVVVNYNSGPGTQAALQSVNVITDQSSLAHSVSMEINQIENPPNIDREQWLVEICHTEYTIDEIANGHAWARLMPGLHGQ